jgi:hypothetical protein
VILAPIHTVGDGLRSIRASASALEEAAVALEKEPRAVDVVVADPDTAYRILGLRDQSRCSSAEFADRGRLAQRAAR